MYDMLGKIGKELFYLVGGGVLMMIASGILGYIVIGKWLNLKMWIRSLILIGAIVSMCWISASPGFLSSLGSTDYQNLRFDLILEMIPIGFCIGQMFGGSKIKISKKKKGEQNGEEDGEDEPS